MKKILISVILIIVLSINCYSYIEKYDGKAYNGGEIVIDDQKFNFKISETSKRIIMTNNNQTLIIGDNQCENSLKYKLCAYNITSGIDNQDEADIKLYYYAANLTVNRKQDKTNVEIGDSIRFDLEILNSGDFTATNINYIDYFPEDITVEKISGICEINDNSIEYKGELRRDEKVNCVYKITPKKESDLKLRAEINYFNGNNEIKEYSDIKQIISTPIFTIKTYIYEVVNENVTKYTSFESTTLTIGKKINLRINLSNSVSENLKFENFSIIFPKGFEIVSSNLNKIDNKYVFNGEVGNGSQKEFYFVVIPKVGDSNKIIFLSDLKKGKKEIKNLEKIIDFNVETKDIELISSLDTLNKFDSGKEIIVSFYAKNNNLFNDLTIIETNLTSVIFPNIYLPKTIIPKNSTVLIYKMNFVSQNVSNTYKFKLETKYSDQEYKVKTLKKEWTANVQKINEIEITKSYTSTKITEDEEAEITVYVKNTRTRPIYNVKINEFFKTPLSYNGKTRTNIGMLKSDEKIEAYKYKIKAPKAKNGTIIEIYTNISYSEDIVDVNTVNSNISINILKMINITVEARKPDLIITKTSARSKLKVGEIQDVKYILKNNDKKTIFDVNIYFSESTDTDIVGKTKYYIKKIDPYEEISFIEERNMPKKEGKTYAGQTMITLIDDGNNFFNYTTNSLYFDVVNTTESMPLIFISKSINTSSAFEDDIVNVTIFVENKGFVGTDLRITDNFKSFDLYVASNSNTNFSYIRKIGKKKEYSPKINANYKYNSNEFTIFGKGTEIQVKQKEKVNITTEQVTTDNVKTDIIETKKEEISKPEIKESVFQKLLKKIKSIFGNT